MGATRFVQPFAADERSIAALRIGIGLCLLGDIGTRIGSYEAFYTDSGVLPRSILERQMEAVPHFSVYFWSGASWWPLCLFAITALLALSFTLGLFTRICNVLLWLLVASLHTRNYTVLQGGDSILLLGLFWCFFLPLDQAWSFASTARSGPRPPRTVLNAGTLALTLQLFAIYFVSGVLKDRMGYWRRGEGVYNALSADHFVTPFGEWLYQFEGLLRVMTHGTLVLELVLPFLLFVPVAFGPVRTATVLLFIGFHAGLGASLDLGLFPWVSAALWLGALPGWFWDQLAERGARWQLGQRLAKLQSALQRPTRALRAVAAWAEPRRSRFASAFDRVSGPRVVQLLGAAALAYSFVLAVSELYPEERPKGVLDAPRTLLRLSQGWRMFVPPYRDAGWFVAVGTHADGSETNVLYGQGGPVSWKRPHYVARTFPDQRWRKYLVNLRKPSFKSHRRRLAAYLCRAWNEKHHGANAVESVRVYYLKRSIGLHYKRGPVQRDLWIEQRCSTSE
jgi:hypothetical protein